MLDTRCQTQIHSPKPVALKWMTFSSGTKRKMQADLAFHSKRTCLFGIERTAAVNPYIIRSKLVGLSFPGPMINLGAHSSMTPMSVIPFPPTRQPRLWVLHGRSYVYLLPGKTELLQMLPPEAHLPRAFGEFIFLRLWVIQKAYVSHWPFPIHLFLSPFHHQTKQVLLDQFGNRLLRLHSTCGNSFCGHTVPNKYLRFPKRTFDK